MTSQKTTAPTFIDLFCGCGGFTLGLLRAGFQCLSAIDNDPLAIDTLLKNLDNHYLGRNISNMLVRDLKFFGPQDFAKLLDGKTVDVVVGGPPCQGFSTARQVDGSNHGGRLKDDPRRYLYQEFLKFVSFFRPKVFILENVVGIRSTASGLYFTRVQFEARELGRAEGLPGYRVHDQLEDAWELGVPQKRRRQLIIGVRGDLSPCFIPNLEPTTRSLPRPTLGAAISDLPELDAGEGTRHYDAYLTKKATKDRESRRYLETVAEWDASLRLTNHFARPHSARDLRDFARLSEGETSAKALRRGVKFEFPYNRSSFKDRFTRQSRKEPCSTIVAHLSKDGLMFIHPTQNRSLTPREAARVQTFPDWFEFPELQTHAFRLIGNAVPPVVSEAIGMALHTFLASCRKGQVRIKPDAHVERISRIANLSPSQIRALSSADLVLALASVLLLVPNLHPLNAADTKGATYDDVNCIPEAKALILQRYMRSGWPVALRIFGREISRRIENDLLSVGGLYRKLSQLA